MLSAAPTNVSLTMPTMRTSIWWSICAKSLPISRRRLRPAKSTLRHPKQLHLGRIARFWWGLIINELVLNAGRYAYPDSPDGTIWVRLLLQPDKQQVLISVRDEGVGLPP